MNNPAEDALESALTLLKHDWVYSFIFDDDRALFVEQFKYALTHSEGILGGFEVAAKPSRDPKTHFIKIDEGYHLLFLPTYTSGSITVGIEVREHFKVSNKFANVPHYRSKFVRDDQRGVFLSIAEHTALGLTDVNFASFLSPGCRNHVIAQFRSVPFRRAMSSIERDYNKEAIKQALTYCFRSSESRPCPSCAAVDPDSCACKLSFMRKLHSFDHDCDVLNTMQYGGLFQGFANLSLYSDGRSIFNTSYSSSSFGRLMFDSNLQKHLSTWAMQDALESDTINILKLTLPMNPDGALDGPSPNEIGGKGDSLLIKEQALSDKSPSRASMMPNDYSLVADTVYHRADVIPHCVSEENNMFHILNSNGQGSTGQGGAVSDTSSIPISFVKPARSGVLSLARGPRCTNHISGGRSPASPQTAGMVKINTVAEQSQHSSSFVQSNASRQDRPTSEHKPASPYSADVQPASGNTGATTLQPQDMLASQLGTEFRQVRLRTKQIFVPLQPGSEDTCGMSISQRNDFLDETSRRIELRKLRNRESAHRSRQRKLMRFKKLQSDLEGAKQRVAFLRKTEKELLEANLSIRSVLSGAGDLSRS